MIDKTVPYIGVIMVKSDIKSYPHFDLPDGYEFTMYHDGYEKHWAKLELSVEEFDNYDDAFNYFGKEFLVKRDILPDRCIFIRTTSGEYAATASVWPGSNFGTEKDRIHWVCVHPQHQGKGLAKAVLSKVLDVFNNISCDQDTYLATQTSSYKAINIYQKFGFTKYTGEKPVNWQSQTTWEQDQSKAWDIIDKKISYYNSKRD